MGADGVTWRKASRSNDKGNECVELAAVGGAVDVRDSKDPNGSRLGLNRRAFRTLLNDIKQQ